MSYALTLPVRRIQAGVSVGLVAALCLSVAGCQTPSSSAPPAGLLPTAAAEAPSPAPPSGTAPVVAAGTSSASQQARSFTIASDPAADALPNPAPSPVQLVEYQAPVDDSAAPGDVLAPPGTVQPGTASEFALPYGTVPGTVPQATLPSVTLPGYAAPVYSDPALTPPAYTPPAYLPSDGVLRMTPDPLYDHDSELSHMEQWRPPNLPGPWPYDEYLCDGGDRALGVRVDRDWTVRGIDTQDTVAHYDTLSGATVVTPSNCVCIYAPRFGAVRHTIAPALEKGQEIASGVDLPLQINSQDLMEGPNTVNQPVQVERSVAMTPPYAFLERNQPLGLDNVRALQGIDFDLLPYEDLAIIRDGQMDASEKARLAELTTAAKIWESNEGVQVLIGGKAANEIALGVLPEEVTRYEMPEGKPCLQIVKIANRHNALPGDIVEFTLRFDNVGNETIGNVTILDSLTTRLEYIPDTAQCTRDADFMVVPNEGDSLILRWELKEPLKVGEGGIIRFQCRVR